MKGGGTAGNLKQHFLESNSTGMMYYYCHKVWYNLGSYHMWNLGGVGGWAWGRVCMLWGSGPWENCQQAYLTAFHHFSRSWVDRLQ
jgi:hypothetical protein